MAPNVVSQSVNECPLQKQEPDQKDYKLQIVWRNVILFSYLHAAALFGAYLMIFSAKWQTTLWSLFLYQISALGITAGAHRLWSHKSYKARLPLRILLAVFNLISFQNSIYEWARDHRMHHKYSETDADPHNSTRGFFFSHIGWLLCKKHPAIKEKGKGIDLSDLDNDKVVAFQKKYYWVLMPIACFIIPAWVPMHYWGESFLNAWFVATMFRYAWVLNMTWLVNSAAHMWGNKPYDKSIMPAENLCVALGAIGEGWHNYHHVFPWDYKAAELGDYMFNPTTMFIDFMAKIGQAYDCKTVPSSIVKSRVARTGDGSHPTFPHPWGWGDKDIPVEDAAATDTVFQKDE